MEKEHFVYDYKAEEERRLNKHVDEALAIVDSNTKRKLEAQQSKEELKRKMKETFTVSEEKEIKREPPGISWQKLGQRTEEEISKDPKISRRKFIKNSLLGLGTITLGYFGAEEIIKGWGEKAEIEKKKTEEIIKQITQRDREILIQNMIDQGKSEEEIAKEADKFDNFVKERGYPPSIDIENIK